ncbi:MAG: hypothetical protein A2Y33_11855 [Spirochaetes bacterium GWF1_51_8]|nr:MAG: hypothetical protein A2Y33_11855 [Spirochaetes bacterium GWF1_51_8]
MGLFRDLRIHQIKRRILNDGIAVALGSGGFKGFFHIGVFAALELLKIPIRRIAGTSAGAIVGAAYAAGIPLDDIIDFAVTFNMGSVLNLGNPVLPGSGILKASGAVDFLRKALKSSEFRDMKIPLSIIATDIITAERIVLEEGDVSMAVRASVSVPAIFEPIIIGNRVLVDGGITENVPVATLRSRWKGIVFASSLTPPLSYPNDIQIKKNKKTMLAFLKTIPVFQDVPWVKEYESPSVDSNWAAILIRAWDIMAYETYKIYIQKHPPDLIVTIDSECNPGMNDINEAGIRKMINLGREKTLRCFQAYGIE